MQIQVYNDWDHVPKALEQGTDQVVLAWDGEYRKGDVIEFDGLEPGHFYVVRADAALDEALVYVTCETILYPVPFYEKKTSYNPLCFFGNRHYLTIRRAQPYEIGRYRNLALNPFDQHEACGVWPHASANVETRGEAVFAARNAIDGVLAAKCHGEWPYESWGINRQDDAALTLEFGRPVDIDEIRLYTRADFPHDNWWVSGKLVFSDGSEMILNMEKKIGEPHCFVPEEAKCGISWVRLQELVKADDPSPFPALTQIEVYGTESIG